MQQKMDILKHKEYSAMENILLFNNIQPEKLEDVIKAINGRILTFQKDMTILSNLSNTNEIGLVIEGEASLIRIDYNGNRTIVSLYEKNELFGGFSMEYMNEEMYVIANTKTKIMLIEYNLLISFKGILKNYHDILIQNMLNIFVKKVNSQNKRIEILNKRTTRDKLLEYFHLLENEQGSSTIKLPFTYTTLAEYLSVDRAAMMREIKYLKEEGIIKTDNRNITLIYR